MNPGELLEGLAQNAEAIVFVNVLLQQLGLPVPAVPTMVVLGGQADAAQLLVLTACAAAASVIADWIWYRIGRRYGYGVLGFLCRMSINPGNCVTQTEDRFTRWGVWSLVIAKFIPGFAIVAPPIAGAVRMPLASFLVAAGAGAAMWAGLALAGGMLFRGQVEALLQFVTAQGLRAGVVAAASLAAWIGWKFWQKRRMERLHSVPRMPIGEFMARIAREPAPLVLDLRSELLRAQEPGVPGSMQASIATVAARVDGVPRSRTVVTMCACPGDAAAVIAAEKLRSMGYADAWPLAGGMEAWLAWNYLPPNRPEEYDPKH